MFRNRPIRWMYLFFVAFYAVLTYLLSQFSLMCAVLGAAAGAVSLVAILLFERSRYRKLAQLAEYLHRVNTGDYVLDLLDNEEGDISILQSELYKVTVTLREQNEALRREKRQLSTALSDISHQLKTPLTSLYVMTDLLCEGNLPEERRVEFTERTRAQLSRLEWLVSSLLKLSKLDAGTVEFRPQETDARLLIEKACAPLRIPAELAEVQLTTEGEGMLFCDPNWTAEALVNILKNCVEHTLAGGVIHIRFASKPVFARIMIEDTGSGIAPEDLPHVFERFYRGKNSAPDSVGIGLAMAEAIVRAQGGSIDVKNRSDSPGTAFYLTFYQK